MQSGERKANELVVNVPVLIKFLSFPLTALDKSSCFTIKMCLLIEDSINK